MEIVFYTSLKVGTISGEKSKEVVEIARDTPSNIYSSGAFSSGN